jgi:hypothetical protein
MRKRLGDIAAATVGALVWILTMSGAALAADNMYPTSNADWGCYDGDPGSGVFCQTDNAALTVYRQDSMTSSAKSVVSTMLSAEYSPTDLTVSVQSSGVYSGGSETDIVYQQSTSGMTGSTIGFTWCDDAVSSLKCDQHYVRFRYDSIDTELACHETGHAVGLTHGHEASPRESQTASELGCMETPDSGNRPHIGAHNKSEINATY